MAKVPWKIIASGVLGVALFGAIIRGVKANGVQVGPKDQQKAERTLTPVAGSDERVALGTDGVAGGNGIVEPAVRETKLAGEAPGRIAEILTEEGAFVKAGQVLATLESKVERALLAAAESDVAAAIADAKSAQARAELSHGVFERTERLDKTGATTADELDRARRQASSDEASYKASQARILSATARRDQAQATLERLQIIAPIDGEILQLKMLAGEYYTPGGPDPFLVMGDTRKLRVRLDIDERDIARVSPGMLAYVTADAFPGKRFTGKVVEVGRRMGRKNVRTDDPTERIDTKILEVVLEIDQPQGLLPGLRVVGFLEGAPAH